MSTINITNVLAAISSTKAALLAKFAKEDNDDAADVTKLTGLIDTIASGITGLEAELTTLQNSIGSLSETQVNQALSAINSTLATARTDIGTLTTGLASAVGVNASQADSISDIIGRVEDLEVSLNVNVYDTAIEIQLPSGVRIKAGSIIVPGSQAYWGNSLFKTAFPSACFAVLPCTGQRGDALSEWQFLTVAAKTAVGFDWSIRTFNVDTNTWTSGATNVRVYYIAIGY